MQPVTWAWLYLWHAEKTIFTRGQARACNKINCKIIMAPLMFCFFLCCQRWGVGFVEFYLAKQNWHSKVSKWCSCYNDETIRHV
jgi:hypothetical protein